MLLLPGNPQGLLPAGPGSNFVPVFQALTNGFFNDLTPLAYHLVHKLTPEVFIKSNTISRCPSYVLIIYCCIQFPVKLSGFKEQSLILTAGSMNWLGLSTALTAVNVESSPWVQ